METERKIRYVEFEETLWSEEVGFYIGYGIKVVENGKEMLKISDVSTDKDAVKALAEKCNKGCLDPIHLFDVIEDYLADPYDEFRNNC